MKPALCLLLMFGVFVPPSTAQSGQGQTDEPAANPARPTVSNPPTLTPVGYLQFETGVLSATDSPEFSKRYEWNEVIKLAESRRLEFVESSEPLVHYAAEGITANGTAEVFLGAQVVLIPREGAKPSLAVSYSRRVYDGGVPELDFGSPRNSSVFYASADGIWVEFALLFRSGQCQHQSVTLRSRWVAGNARYLGVSLSELTDRIEPHAAFGAG